MSQIATSVSLPTHVTHVEKLSKSFATNWEREAKGLVAKLTPLHVQSIWGFRRKRVWVAGLAGYCNYFSKKKKKFEKEKNLEREYLTKPCHLSKFVDLLPISLFVDYLKVQGCEDIFPNNIWRNTAIIFTRL